LEEAIAMIVVGMDVHKHSLTAVAVDEAGRARAERTVAAAPELLAWSASLGPERLWALEDCRQLTRPLERALLAADERLVRVPPKLMAPQRRAGRMRGKSDPIDALAVARAALREPRLDHPRPGEQRLRELKLLVDHRDDLIDERRRAQQRCAGICTTSTPSWRSRSVRSTVASGSTGSADASPASSSRRRSGSRASSSSAAAASRVPSWSSTASWSNAQP
jgi:transposase